MCTAAAGAGPQAFDAGAGLQAFGAGFGAVSSRNQRYAMASYYQYQAAAVKNQATLAANNIEQVAGMQISQVADQGRQVLGAQRVAMGANGISSDSFSYGQVLDSTVAQNKLDQMAVAYNADMKAREIQNNANIEAAGYEASAANARKAGNMALVGGLLNGAAQFSDTWAKWQQTSQGQTAAAPAVPTVKQPELIGPYINGQLDMPKWQYGWTGQYKRSIYGG